MHVALVGYGAMNKLVEEELVNKGHSISGIVALDQLSNLDEITKPFDLIVDLFVELAEAGLIKKGGAKWRIKNYHTFVKNGLENSVCWNTGVLDVS